MFTVVVTSAIGGDFEEKHESAEKVVRALQRLVYGPMASMGLIKHVKVIDPSDFVCFEVSNGRVCFPPGSTIPPP